MRFKRHVIGALLATHAGVTTAAEALKGKILLLLPDGVDQGGIDHSFFGFDERTH